MTQYADRANKLPIENSEFLWRLIIDMARTIDLLMSQTEPSTDEAN